MNTFKKPTAWVFENDKLIEQSKIPIEIKPPFIARIIFDDIKHKESIRRIGAITWLELKNHKLSFIITDEISTENYTNISEENIISFEILLNGDKFSKKFTIRDNQLKLKRK